VLTEPTIETNGIIAALFKRCLAVDAGHAVAGGCCIVGTLAVHAADGGGEESGVIGANSEEVGVVFFAVAAAAAWAPEGVVSFACVGGCHVVVVVDVEEEQQWECCG